MDVLPTLIAAVFAVAPGSVEGQPSASQQALATPAGAWGSVEVPAPGPSEAIGSYASGCLRGGRPLAARGPGYEVLRLSRRRYFGHASLIGFIERLAGAVARARLGPLLVGDLAQPRGGPTPFGHRSHQNGLDVDIAYPYPQRLKTRRLRNDARERLQVAAVVNLATGELTQAWSPRVASVIALAAEDRIVDRIFVHPTIKRALCRSHPSAGWLRRVRPWWGHHDHFHVRLACPAGNPQCVAQEPLPEDNGCSEESLSWWASHDAQKVRESRSRSAAPPVLPADCTDLMLQPFSR